MGYGFRTSLKGVQQPQSKERCLRSTRSPLLAETVQYKRHAGCGCRQGYLLVRRKPLDRAVTGSERAACPPRHPTLHRSIGQRAVPDGHHLPLGPLQRRGDSAGPSAHLPGAGENGGRTPRHCARRSTKGSRTRSSRISPSKPFTLYLPIPTAAKSIIELSRRWRSSASIWRSPSPWRTWRAMWGCRLADSDTSLSRKRGSRIAPTFFGRDFSEHSNSASADHPGRKRRMRQTSQILPI
jgi:hypothetical protein